MSKQLVQFIRQKNYVILKHLTALHRVAVIVSIKKSLMLYYTLYSH